MTLSQHCLPIRFQLLALVLGMTSCGACLASDQVFTADYAACAEQTCPPHSLAWSAGEFDQIHLVEGAANTHNLHPQILSAEALAKVLVELRQTRDGEQFRVFNARAAGLFAEGLSTALAKARPQQDLLFLITSKVPTGALIDREFGNSGRAFLDARGLNLIFGEVMVDFIARYEATYSVTHTVRTFDFGSRSRTADVTLSDDRLDHPRRDWVTIPLVTSVDPITGQDRIVPAVAIPHRTAAGPQGADAVPVSPYPRAPDPGTAATIPAPVRGGETETTAERRLQALQRLRQKELLSEQEYQERRRAVLDGL